MKIKIILDIVLIMALTILAVIYLGPIIIDIPVAFGDENKLLYMDCERTCSETGRPIKEYLVDEYGETIGWIHIEYHDNGNFKRVTEQNLRDNSKTKVYYSEENEFLYWYEIIYDSDGNILNTAKFGPDGIQIN